MPDGDAEDEWGSVHYPRLVRSSRVFILGSGFSAAAGLPFLAELGQHALRVFRLECPGRYSHVMNDMRTLFGSSVNPDMLTAEQFISLCSFLHYQDLRLHGGGDRWTDAGTRELLALRFFLARSLVERTPRKDAIPELIVNFASQLTPTDWVITVNWDVLLEGALEHLQKPYSYSLDPCVTQIRKVHGSVNWRLGSPQTLRGEPPTLTWHSLDFPQGMMGYDAFWCADLEEIGGWEGRECLGEVQPFLVLPGLGKFVEARQLAPLWYKMDGVFVGTHDIYIIGVSLLDDFILRFFLMDTLPYIAGASGVPGRRIRVINPEDEALARYDFLSAVSPVEKFQEPFSQRHVDMMVADLPPGDE